MRLIDEDATEAYLLDGRYIIEPAKHGKWILKSEAPITREKYWECSLCGCGSDSFDTVYFTPYCPNCGAKMENIE